MSDPKKAFIITVHSVQVMDYLDYRDYLRQVYQALKVKMERYSFLQLAEDIGLSRSNVAFLIINGQRPLTSKAAKKITQHLQLSDQNRLYFETLVSFQNARTSPEREQHFRKLMHLKAATFNNTTTKNQLAFFAEWYNAAIYEIAVLKDAPNHLEDIAESLQPRITNEQAYQALDLLKKLGLIQIDAKTGRLSQTQARIVTPPEVQSMAMLRFHQSMLALAHKSLSEVHDSERDVTGVTIAIPSAMVPEFKRELAMFRERLLSIAEAAATPSDRVYQFNLQMFPLTKSNTRKFSA